MNSALPLTPAQCRLLRRIRSTLEARGVREKGHLHLRAFDPEEADALADLLALPLTPHPPLRISLDKLDAALRSSSVNRSLIDTLEALDGPLQDKRAERAAQRDAEAEFWRQAAKRQEIEARPALESWLARLQRGGLKRAAQGVEPRQALEDALAIIEKLPSPGTRLQVLAAETLGDPHALDLGTPVGSLVTSALATLSERSMPSSAADRRSLWAWAGVSLDDLSSDVLVVGLRPRGESLLARTLSAFAAQGEPFRITLRQLARADLDFRHLRTVYICENPTLVSLAADRMGGDTPPLICTEGMLTGACEEVLRAMRAQGVQIHFHGDFDWGGIRIGNVLVERFKATPWAYGAEDYARAMSRLPRRVELESLPMVASWDPKLTEAMQHTGFVAYEEQLVEELLNDLTARSVPDGGTAPKPP